MNDGKITYEGDMDFLVELPMKDILNPPSWMKTTILFLNYKKIIIPATLLACLLIALVAAMWSKKNNEEKKYYGEYYISETGTKYHEKNCMFVKDKTSIRRLTEEKFESGNHESSKTCLP